MQGGQQQRAKTTGQRTLALALCAGSDVRRAASLKSEDPVSGGITDSEGDSVATDGGTSKHKQGGRRGDLLAPQHMYKYTTCIAKTVLRPWQVLHMKSPEVAQCCNAGSSRKARRMTCRNCATHHTPQWRCGPEGPRTLCNACGVRGCGSISLSPCHSRMLHGSLLKSVVRAGALQEGPSSEWLAGQVKPWPFPLGISTAEERAGVMLVSARLLAQCDLSINLRKCCTTNCCSCLSQCSCQSRFLYQRALKHQRCRTLLDLLQGCQRCNSK